MRAFGVSLKQVSQVQEIIPEAERLSFLSTLIPHSLQSLRLTQMLSGIAAATTVIN